MIFVFGSNEAGIHGAGAADHAYRHEGAVWGKGDGLAGNSYAIPTKDLKILTLPLATIAVYVDEFVAFAESRPDLEFNVTRIGCGFAGYTDTDIAPLFADAPANCHLPVKGEYGCLQSWRDIIADYQRATS